MGCSQSDAGVAQRPQSTTSTGGKSGKPKLGYWNLRGRGASLKYFLAYCKVDYEFVEYNTAPDGSSWFGVKNTLGLAFPNIPYIIDGDVKITENVAVH
jgi:glutathione S-transferase